MTDFTFDRDFSTEATSSVIDHIYYSTDEKKLIIKLFRTDWWGNRIVAGYEDVPVDVFTALETLNKNRLGGDSLSSVGAYWNTWIKPNFGGFSTVDLNIVSAKQPDSAEPEATRPGRPFIVHFETDRAADGELSDISVYAADEDSALVIFYKIAELAGWEDFNVRAITRIFD